MAKKYYWLKLKRDFFKRHDVKIIEDMDNGKDYILFYMKLLVESIDHEGHLRFSEEIPYDEKMLAAITNTGIDTVRCAMKIFQEFKLVELLDDRTIYMRKIEEMIGSETEWAEKKRLQRTKNKELPAPKEDNVPNESLSCPDKKEDMSDKRERQSYSKSIDKEREEEKPISPSEKFGTFNPGPTADTFTKASAAITEIIVHWNTKSNWAKCRSNKSTLPDISDVTQKLDAYNLDEVTKAIDNLSNLYDKMGTEYKPTQLHKFIINSLERWTDEAKPWVRYEAEKKDPEYNPEPYKKRFNFNEK